MGRRVNDRKISNDRVRKERRKRTTMLIAVEGKNKTEKNYFSNFEKEQCLYNIIYARGNDTGPLKLVQMLIKEINKLDLNLNDGDLAFCVFDCDNDPNKNTIIMEATKLANSYGIGIITSTPCIELWFLLHFQYTSANMSNDEVIKKLKHYFPKYEKCINIYPFIADKTDAAIQRAKKLEKYQIDSGKIIGTVDANPSTLIYKIVDILNCK